MVNSEFKHWKFEPHRLHFCGSRAAGTALGFGVGDGGAVLSARGREEERVAGACGGGDDDVARNNNSFRS
jgi:hypothetical protein